MNTDVFNISEAASLLRCGTKTVRRLVKRGDLPARDLTPAGLHRNYRFSQQSLDQFLNPEPMGTKKSGALNSLPVRISKGKARIAKANAPKLFSDRFNTKKDI